MQCESARRRNQRKVLSRGREKQTRVAIFSGRKWLWWQNNEKKSRRKNEKGLIGLTEDVWIRGRGAVVVMEVVAMVVIMAMIMLLWV